MQTRRPHPGKTCSVPQSQLIGYVLAVGCMMNWEIPAAAPLLCVPPNAVDNIVATPAFAKQHRSLPVRHHSEHLVCSHCVIVLHDVGRCAVLHGAAVGTVGAVGAVVAVGAVGWYALDQPMCGAALASSSWHPGGLGGSSAYHYVQQHCVIALAC